MLQTKLKLFIGLIILVIISVMFYCRMVTLKWRKEFDNYGGSDPDTPRAMRNGSSDALNEVDALTFHSTNGNASLGDIHASISMQETPYHRIDDIPERTKRLPFLKYFKNPCWRESVNLNKSSRIRCLPYFYSVGLQKCGTTDIHRRLIRHPQISSNVKKEIMWITPTRFGMSKEKSRLSTYLKYFDEAVIKDILPSGKNGYHDAIIGDFSPKTFWHNKHYWKSTFPNFTSNADVIHHLYPDTKIIVTLRNPVTRSYSEFKHFTKNPTPALFHTRVVTMIKEFDGRCRKTKYLRKCIDEIRASDFLLIGVYYVYMEDYLRLFPRQQMLITKVEDRYRDMTSALKKMFSFLEIRSLSDEEVADIVELPIQNRKRHHIPEMFNKTRLILEEFYRPFNEKLGNLIGQEYNYNI